MTFYMAPVVNTGLKRSTLDGVHIFCIKPDHHLSKLNHSQFNNTVVTTHEHCAETSYILVENKHYTGNKFS